MVKAEVRALANRYSEITNYDNSIRGILDDTFYVAYSYDGKVEFIEAATDNVTVEYQSLPLSGLPLSDILRELHSNGISTADYEEECIDIPEIGAVLYVPHLDEGRIESVAVQPIPRSDS